MNSTLTSVSYQIVREAERPQQEEEEIKTGGDEEEREEVENDGETSAGANPLDKYMKVVMEAREKQHSQVRCTQVCFLGGFWSSYERVYQTV